MAKTHYIIPIFVPHEGCPHNCVFCNQGTITGSQNSVNADFVTKTIEEYIKTINSKDSTIEVSFFGGTFTAINIEKQRELLAVAKKYKEAGVVHYIRLSTRPDYINKEILDNLRNYNVDIIELGVQSLDREVLLNSGRGHTELDVFQASALIKQYGFVLGHQIMLGLPGDNFEKDILTAKKIISMKPSICRIYPALVIKDTPMEQLYLKKLYNPYSLDQCVEISKHIYGMFKINNINVIRIGLQPTEEINVGKELVAGPFHPSFRELVEGSLYKDLIIDSIPKNYNGDFILSINPKDISKLYANKKQFFNDIKKQLQTANIIVKQDNSIKRDEFTLLLGGNCIKLSIYEYLLDKYKEG